MAMLGYLPESEVLTHRGPRIDGPISCAAVQALLDAETGRFSDKKMVRDDNLVAVGARLPILYDLLAQAYALSDPSMSEFVTSRRMTPPRVDYNEDDYKITVVIMTSIEACFDTTRGASGGAMDTVTVWRTDTDASITFSLSPASTEGVINKLDLFLRPRNI